MGAPGPQGDLGRYRPDSEPVLVGTLACVLVPLTSNESVMEVTWEGRSCLGGGVGATVPGGAHRLCTGVKVTALALLSSTLPFVYRKAREILQVMFSLQGHSRRSSGDWTLWWFEIRKKTGVLSVLSS